VSNAPGGRSLPSVRIIIFPADRSSRSLVDVSKIDIDLLGPGPPAAGGPVARQVRFHHPFAAL